MMLAPCTPSTGTILYDWGFALRVGDYRYLGIRNGEWFVADMLHVCAICILAYRIKKSRNCIGLSCKTQEIYLIVFCMRYVDLFMYYISLYNTLMKVFFIAATGFIVYLMRFKKPYCTTYDSMGDDFPHLKVLLPVALVLTCLV